MLTNLSLGKELRQWHLTGNRTVPIPRNKMEELNQEQIDKFVRQVVSIEKKYGFELKNSTTARHQEIMQLIKKFVSEEVSNDNSED